MRTLCSIGGNLDCTGFLNGKRYLLMDRDGKFSLTFKSFLEDEGVNPVVLPPKSPNLNAHLAVYYPCPEK
jgi:hypothetical protein